MKDKETDLEVLDRALVPADLDWIPPDIAAALDPLSTEELDRLLVRGENIKTLVAAQQGLILLTLKTRLKHGQFEKHLKELGWPYDQANMCMNIARGLMRHPGLQAITSVKVLRRILYLPEHKQAEIEVEFAHVDPRGKKRTWKDLRGWIVKLVADEAVRKTKKAASATRQPTKKAPEPLPEHNTDPAWVTVRDQWGEAVTAMCRLVKAAESVEMKREYFDEVFDLKMCSQLGHQLDLLGEILTPYEERKRRGLNEE